MMPLNLAQVGEENIIRKVGGSPQMRLHLENLGFLPGTQIILVSKIGGSVIVNVKESRVAISDQMAARIMI